MPLYNMQSAISTYSINKSLIEKIEDFLQRDSLEILNIKSKNGMTDEKNTVSITIHDPFGHERYTTIREYKHNLFKNDTEGISVRHELMSESVELKITLRFSKKEDSTYLAISLMDTSAREKVSAIEEGIFTILDRQNNMNWLLYPRQPILAIIVLGCLAAGLVAWDHPKPILRFSLGLLFWSGIFYFAICRYFKGYCTFDTNKQTRLDQWFNWLVFGLAGFLLFSTLLTSVRNYLFGF
jgi:hypothetical protein